jgi:hypothetical protein
MGCSVHSSYNVMVNGEVIVFCFLSSSLSGGDGLLCLRSLEISGVLKWLLLICVRSIGV